MKTAIAKLFQHGGSQALRLPKDFRLLGTTAKLSTTARGILVQPVEDNRRRAREFAKLQGSCPQWRRVGRVPDFFMNSPDSPIRPH